MLIYPKTEPIFIEDIKNRDSREKIVWRKKNQEKLVTKWKCKFSWQMHD